VKYYPVWPEQGKRWVESTLASDGLESGIRTITRVMADDSSGHMGTKAFSRGDKDAITRFLLSNDDFLTAARKNFAGSE